MSSIPVVTTGTSLAQNIWGTIAGDDRLSSAAAIPGEVLGLATEGLMAMKDPVYALASAGLSIVLELVEPFNDAIEYVSGSPDDMKKVEEAWGKVATSLTTLSSDTSSAVGENLTQWQGQAATAAQEQLDALSAAIAAASNEASNVAQIVSWCRMLAEAIKAVIESILAELVSWLITRGLIALATGPWSFGASVATFVLSAFYKATSMFLRAMNKVKHATGIFGKILRVFFDQALNRKGPFHVTAGQPFGIRDSLNYSLWKGVLIKAGIGGGVSLMGNASQAIGDFFDSPAAPTGGGGGGGSTGAVAVDLDELDGLQSALQGLKGQAEGISSQAGEVLAEEMTWGVPGWVGLDGHYSSTAEGLQEAIGEIGAAFDGHAMRIGDCRSDYAACDEEQADALNKLMSELGA
ncbi:hypothetical protein [Glycomyces sp. NPDC048151]|uniref:WXG100-like domain-containing protein n=1 Tax=Glycomyces sp. NPDC048151 TaxID=3364002 RepID=UPI00371C1A2E